MKIPCMVGSLSYRIEGEFYNVYFMTGDSTLPPLLMGSLRTNLLQSEYRIKFEELMTSLVEGAVNTVIASNTVYAGHA
jgi:hypothetical protein